MVTYLVAQSSQNQVYYVGTSFEDALNAAKENGNYSFDVWFGGKQVANVYVWREEPVT